MLAEGGNVKQEKSTAPGAQQLATDRAVRPGILVQLVEPDIADFAAELAFELPRLMERLTKLDQSSAQ